MGMKWLMSEVTERREFYVYLLYLTIKFHEISRSLPPITALDACEELKKFLPND